MVILTRPNVPLIPEMITVHLGAPDEPAENITIPFPDYIKNVASSEIYPTWPQSATRANIYAQITFALNRIYSQWYRSQGYDFDITSSAQFDQSFIQGRSIFENISKAVDTIFTSYVVRQGENQPLPISFCEGTDTLCGGFSKWGSLELAQQGYTPYDILKYYLGNDIDIVTDVPVDASFKSYPLYPIKVGNFGLDVSTLQHELNQIRNNYPSIPEITFLEQGVFGVDTEAAVKEFQKIFNLVQDGIVGSATWYQIKYVYESVRGIDKEIQSRFTGIWQEGDSDSVIIKLIQYYIRVFGCYYPDVPVIEITGYYGPETTEAVKALQKKFDLVVDGNVSIETWARFNEEYKTILHQIPPGCLQNKTIYPGYVLSRGMGDKNVTLMQTYLSKISEADPEIPAVTVTNIFDEQMEAAVRAVQEKYNVGEVTGVIGAPSWNLISEIYESLPNK